MKKLLFIIFFPITIPVYLIYRFFVWFSDTFIPFVQYDAIPFFQDNVFPLFTDKLFPAIKKLIKSVKEKSAEKEIKETPESITTYSADTQTINPTAKNDSDINLQSYSNETENISQAAESENDVYYPKEKSIRISDTVTIEDSGITVTGHLPPYTNEEYRKIKYYETQTEINVLKKSQGLDSFKHCYYSAGIYEYWGAKYRLLAIKCFEECLKYTPTVPITNIYSSLVTLYEKDHQFEKAVNILQKYIDEAPEYSSGYKHKAQCLVKLGKIDEAIDMLNAVKETDYYKSPNPTIDPSFARSIDYEIEKCLDKKKRGYKFKSKKASFDYIDPDNFSLHKICNEYLQKWS